MQQKSLKDKLMTIQQTLNAPKNLRNNFGNYHYRSAEGILEALKPLLKEQELTLMIDDEIVYVGERYYVKATVSLSDGDATLTTTAYAREEETKKGMDGSQITGASSSYARKYALNGMFAIDDTKDSDATNDHGKGDKESRKKAVDPIASAKSELMKELRANGVSTAEMPTTIERVLGKQTVDTVDDAKAVTQYLRNRSADIAEETVADDETTQTIIDMYQQDSR